MHRHRLTPLADRGPLRTMFVITSMPVGGAETLLVNMVRKFDRGAVLPELCCLKEPGPLGELLAAEIPTVTHQIRHKYDVGVIGRVGKLFRQRRIDAVVTVGAGDKMFWGRLAARRAGVPVILSALHSTGWPDGVGRLNRLLTPITDGFIAVAPPHGQYLVDHERFPARKVFVIPNGIDSQRFRPQPLAGQLQAELGLPAATPLVGIVAALRSEKNHALFLRAAARVRHEHPTAHFVIVGDGPERTALENLTATLGLYGAVHFLGTRSDVPEVLAGLDLFVLSSDNEANPVSILEAMACGKPVVATDVGSVYESVQPGRTGFLVKPGDEVALAERIGELILDGALRARLGANARDYVVANASLEVMVGGYELLLAEIYSEKVRRSAPRTPAATLDPNAAGCLPKTS